uniref:Glycerol-3-phosphate dehydrogenase [NAD(+)] n=1 Tax=Triatoma infestans TaxID=30076 RepID=B4XU25_TRIIF|nr:glycerol-3-phosphate dehydrogenase [Triatoma infestans]
MSGKKVSIVGSGNWGSAIAKIIGANVVNLKEFDNEVKMYVYEELVDGKKLTEIINTTHENVKYLPGHKLPENVVAVPDLVNAACDADFLVFVVPHQFVEGICKSLVGKIKSSAVGLSLIKGFEKKEGGGIELISSVIKRNLNIDVCVLMGANIASEVASGKFCETTIGCVDKKNAELLHKLIETDYFRVKVVQDVNTVELCGALKNIVAPAAGFIDGLGYGENTKAAIIRIGLMEMINFIDYFYPKSKVTTYFESCGIADLITTCYGGRNRRLAEQFVITGKSFDELEKELLNGQKLQGPITAEEVNYMLENKQLETKFPLFTAVNRISKKMIKPEELITFIKSHPAVQFFTKKSLKP